MTKLTKNIEYYEYENSDELPIDEQYLIAVAIEARKTAYAPYSHFKVGAAIQTETGEIFIGNNQENANYKGSCAERTALDALGVAGLKDKILKIAIFGAPETLDLKEKPKTPEDPITPCGQCRQDLEEVESLSQRKITILMASRNKIRKIVGMENLLPWPFGPHDLGITYEK